MAGKLVEKDGNAIDGSAALEVRLDLLRRGSVVNIANEDAASINILLVLPKVSLAFLNFGLHFAQLGGFFLHLTDALLHAFNVLLYCQSVLCHLILEDHSAIDSMENAAKGKTRPVLKQG
jgi:hypothetical protein